MKMFHIPETKDVFVSRATGNDTSSCGSQIYPCRTISQAVAHASSGDYIHLDSTDTKSQPYTCDPLTSRYPGIYISDSLTLAGFPNMAHIKCSFEGRLFINGTKDDIAPTIRLRNISFDRSTLQIDDFNAEIENCTFNKNIFQAVLFRTARLITKLTIRSSYFMNNQGCLQLHVCGVSGTQKVVVEISNSFFSGTRSSGEDQGVLVAYDKYSQNRSFWDIIFKTVILDNNSHWGGGLIAFYLERGETNEVYSNVQVRETFSNLLDSSAYFSQTAKSNISVIGGSTFQDNTGHVMTIVTSSLVLGIITSTFVNNIAQSSGGALNLVPSQFVQMTVRNSTFTQNVAENGIGGAVCIENGNQIDFVVENTTFFYNRAANGGCDIDVSGRQAHFLFKGVTSSPDGPNSQSLTLSLASFASFEFSHCLFQRLVPPGLVLITYPHGRFLMYKTTFVNSTLEIGFGGSVNITDCCFNNGYSSTWTTHAKANPLDALNLQGSNGIVLLNSLTFTGFAGTFLKGDFFTNTVVTTRQTLFNGSSFSAVKMKLNRNNDILFENCTFYGNKQNNSLVNKGGAVFLKTALDSLQEPCAVNHFSVGGSETGHRVWKYNNHVHFRNTVFSGNVAASGGAIFVENGDLKLENCRFINNIAAYQGGHVLVGGQSTRTTITNSVFFQDKAELEERTTVGTAIYRTISFLHSESAGPLSINGTSFEVQTPSNVHSMISVSGGGLVDFANRSVLVCSTGSSLVFQNFSSVIHTEYNNSKCNLSSSMLLFSCELCYPGSYSIQQGSSVGMAVEPGFQCRLCPYGADCSFNIVAKPNFWGYRVSDTVPALNFTFCPLNYCQPPVGTRPQEYNGCYGNRTGYLCGLCKKHFSESLFSTTCQLSTECKDVWFWAVAVAVVAIFALYLILKPPVLPLIYWLIKDSRETEQVSWDKEETNADNGYLKIVFYFYQVSDLLLISTSSGILLKSHVILPFVGFFNFRQMPFGASSVCPFRGLTAVTKELFLSLGVFAVLTAIFAMYLIHCLLLRVMRRTEPPLLGRYIAAVVETILLGYASLARTSFTLLSCVSVGSVKRLFIEGDIVCYQWWQYLITTVIIFFVVPFIFALGWASVKFHRHTISVKQFLLAMVFPLPQLFYWIYRSFKVDDAVIQGMGSAQCKSNLARVVYGPFREAEGDNAGSVYWESVLIGRRLALIVLHSLITNPFFRLLSLSFVCVLVLFHHFAVKPFHSPKANKMETISLLGLVFIAVVNLCKACFISAGVDPRGPVKSLFDGLDWVETALLGFVPGAFVVVIVLTLVMVCCRIAVFLFVFLWRTPAKIWLYLVADNEEEIKPFAGGEETVRS